MLVLSRKVGEKIVIPETGVTVTIVEMHGNRVKLGFQAPPEIRIHRAERLNGSPQAIVTGEPTAFRSR